jgi:hypothetical protein
MRDGVQVIYEDRAQIKSFPTKTDLTNNAAAVSLAIGPTLGVETPIGR